MQKLLASVLPAILAATLVAGVAEAKVHHHTKVHTLVTTHQATAKKLGVAKVHTVKKHKKARRHAK